MNNISGYPYFEVQFTKEGAVFDKQAVDLLLTGMSQKPVTDLLVISHGWNNDMNDARVLYKNFVPLLAKQQSALGLSNRSFAVLGVLWPSKKFAEKELIAGGGAASLSGTGQPEELQVLLDQLENLSDSFDDDGANNTLQKAKIAAKNIQRSSNAQHEFVQQMNALMTDSVQKNAVEADEDDIPSLGDVNAKELLMKLEDHWDTEMPSDGGGAASMNVTHRFSEEGGAAGMDFSFDGIISGARNLLNGVTYYQMKERAGKVGSLGLHPVLKQIRGRFPQIKLHLIGHSFGGRLVTAAVAGPDGPSTLTVDTLILLQAAFSHYAFAKNYEGTTNGFFRRVVSEGKVLGPILVSYTRNDQAVGLAYAIASRIAKQVGSGLGDKEDFYGGMGGNGAQITPEANNDFALNGTTMYTFNKGVLYNLKSDTVISSHSDICKAEVARAVLSAIA
ncbi:MAG: hypothetical protein WKF97_19055 [Chitinophagaceae bacterium]